MASIFFMDFLPVLSWGLFISANIVGLITNTINWNYIGLLCGFIWVGGGALCFGQSKKKISQDRRKIHGSKHLNFIFNWHFPFQRIDSSLSFYSCYHSHIIWIIFISTKRDEILRNWRSLGAGAIFGSYLIPYQLSKMDYMDFVYPFSAGFLSLLIF